MHELDPQKLEERIMTARLAINRRLEDLKIDGDRRGERQEIEDAMHRLQTLDRTNHFLGNMSASGQETPPKHEAQASDSSACAFGTPRGNNVAESTVAQNKALESLRQPLCTLRENHGFGRLVGADLLQHRELVPVIPALNNL
jgi:hypothetical protein